MQNGQLTIDAHGGLYSRYTTTQPPVALGGSVWVEMTPRAITPDSMVSLGLTTDKDFNTGFSSFLLQIERLDQRTGRYSIYQEEMPLADGTIRIEKDRINPGRVR